MIRLASPSARSPTTPAWRRFAIADGARPGPNKADSVLRSVIRRACGYGRNALDQKQPFLHKLVPTVVEQMGDAFPELRERQDQVADVIEQEEADFFKVIDLGIELYNEYKEGRVPGSLLLFQ